MGTLLGDRRLLARRLLCALGRPQVSLGQASFWRTIRRQSACWICWCGTRLVHERATAEGTRYELAHSVLLRSWPTLQRWMSDPRSSDPSHPALSASAQSLQGVHRVVTCSKRCCWFGGGAASAATVHVLRRRRQLSRQIDEFLRQALAEMAAARSH